MGKTILFLCTGNYYRSRFAEILFNHMAEQDQLAWRAQSRGLATELGIHNVGPLSSHARAALQQRGIHHPDMERFPRQVVETDFREATRIIAMDEQEHRAMMLQRYPEWVDQLEYWRVADLDWTPPEEALPELALRIEDLVKQLMKSARNPVSAIPFTFLRSLCVWTIFHRGIRPQPDS